MPRLTLRRAAETFRPLFLVVRGTVYAIRPGRSYSLDELIELTALTTEFVAASKALKDRDPLTNRMSDTVAIYQDLMRRIVRLGTGVDAPVRDCRKLVQPVLEYLSDSSGNDRGTAQDLGQLAADLQRIYSGSARDWWRMPIYQLVAYAKAKPPKKGKEQIVGPDAFHQAVVANAQ